MKYNINNEYYTIRLRRNVIDEYLNFRKKFQKYTISDLARDVGYSVSYLHDVYKDRTEGELSPRFVATMIKVTSFDFHMLFEIVRIERNTRNDLKYPKRTKGALRNAPVRNSDGTVDYDDGKEKTPRHKLWYNKKGKPVWVK